MWFNELWVQMDQIDVFIQQVMKLRCLYNRLPIGGIESKNNE